MWQEIITKLLEKGFTQMEIAEFSNCSQSYVHTLLSNKRGKSISFEIGSKLKEMFEKSEKNEIEPKRKTHRPRAMKGKR